MNSKPTITISITINAPIEKVWKFYTTPEHITHWNNASPDWHSPRAENDLKAGGKFDFRMEARDGSSGFDFAGVYAEVIQNKLITYTISGDDARKVKIIFGTDLTQINQTKVEVSFEAEAENPLEMQRGGWQSILNNFKDYVESN